MGIKNIIGELQINGSKVITEETLPAGGSFSGSYNDLTDKPNIPTVPTKVSAFENDKGYLTEHQSLEGLATETYVDTKVTEVKSCTWGAGNQYIKLSLGERYATGQLLLVGETGISLTLIYINLKWTVYRHLGTMPYKIYQSADEPEACYLQMSNISGTLSVRLKPLGLYQANISDVTMVAVDTLPENITEISLVELGATGSNGSDNKFMLGTSLLPINLYGSGNRPVFNDQDIALTSDIPDTSKFLAKQDNEHVEIETPFLSIKADSFALLDDSYMGINSYGGGEFDIEGEHVVISGLRYITAPESKDSDTLSPGQAGQVLMSNGDGVHWGNGWGNGSSLMFVTHSELKSLRDNSELVPGTFYRITDYVCTTSQENTRAMDNKFDIIVQALSANTLSEIASADYHYEDGEPDGYFQKAGNGQTLNITWVCSLGAGGYEGNSNIIFGELGSEENNEGEVVPVLYKMLVDEETGETTVDYEDRLFYIGSYEFEGETYDRWRFIETGSAEEGCHTWDSDDKKFILTNTVVENNEFIISNASEVSVAYTMYDDDNGSYIESSKGDTFVEASYGENNEGMIVPILYKTNLDSFPETDYEDIFYYVGQYEYAGETYDRWRKIEPELGWDDSNRIYALTNIVIENNQFIDGVVESNSSGVGANLPAWELKYCLDNDTTRFAWALDGQAITNLNSLYSSGVSLTRQPIFDGSDIGNSEYYYAWGTRADVDDDDSMNFWYSKNPTITNGETLYAPSDGTFQTAEVIEGRGVIYYMKDEHRNECPYDFKNIQFKRKVSLENGYPTLDEENGVETWVYTFCGNSYHIDNDELSELKDGSLESPYGHQSDEDTSTFHHNVMGEYILFYDQKNEDSTICGRQYLNNNVFFGYWEEIGSTSPDDCPYYYAYCCYNNKLGLNCYSNTFGRSCNANTFGRSCSNNTFGEGCGGNTFGDSCGGNTFGEGCGNNTFGRSCNANTFGEGCSNNTFGDKCGGNTFGRSCGGNTFGYNCSNNTFGYNCSNNTFGYNCSNNTFGENTQNNYFAKQCRVSQISGANNFYACSIYDETLSNNNSFITTV